MTNMTSSGTFSSIIFFVICMCCCCHGARSAAGDVKESAIVAQSNSKRQSRSLSRAITLNRVPLSSAVDSSTYVDKCLCTFHEDYFGSVGGGELRCHNVSGSQVLAHVLDMPQYWCNMEQMDRTVLVASQKHQQQQQELPQGRSTLNRYKHRSEYRRVRRLSVLGSFLANFTFDCLKKFDSLNVLVMNDNDFQEEQLRVTDGFQLTTLTYLDLIGNNLTHLPPRLLSTFPRLQTIKLERNNLTMLHENFFSSAFVPELENISVKDNPWRCDLMWWFIQWLRFNASSSVHLEDAHLIKCLPCEVRRQVTCFHHVTLDNFLGQCPKNCTCSMVRSNVAVDCRNRGYHDFPAIVPEGFGVLYMENNTIRSLQALKVVQGYHKLRYLYIDNNYIDSINDLDGTNFEELTTLHISGNRLRQLSVHVFEKLFALYLDEVTLGNNPWNCECQTVVPFGDLLNSRRRHFKDIDQIRCSANSSVYPNQPIHRLSAIDFCSGSLSVHPLDVVNGMFATLIVLIVAKLLYDYRAFKRTGQIPICPYCPICSRI